MACHEIGVMRGQICNSLRSTVDGWQYDLQARYGDPRVYAHQQAEMNRVDAAVAHDLSRRNSTLLNDAYEVQRKRQRTQHEKRITKKLSNPGRRGSAKPPESAAPTRKQPPPDVPPPAHP